jgi:hypothetical protein
VHKEPRRLSYVPNRPYGYSVLCCTIFGDPRMVGVTRRRGDQLFQIFSRILRPSAYLLVYACLRTIVGISPCVPRRGCFPSVRSAIAPGAWFECVPYGTCKGSSQQVAYVKRPLVVISHHEAQRTVATLFQFRFIVCAAL